MGPTASKGVLVTHPLDPLTAEEVTRAWEIIHAQPVLGDRVWFVSIDLHEPPKALVLGHSRRPVDRAAFVVVLDSAAAKTYEAVVSLRGAPGLVAARPDVQPAIMLDEFMACEEAVRPIRVAGGAAQARRRGLQPGDGRSVVGRPLRLPRTRPGGGSPARSRWVRREPRDNGYARPMESLVAVVDLNKMEVLRVEDYGVVPLRPGGRQLRAERFRHARRTSSRSRSPSPRARASGRRPRDPLAEVAPAVGFTPREGLVLHTVELRGPGRERPILYRASLSRDGRPLRRPGAHPLPQERLRPGRVRHRHAGQLARARLRLPRRDPLLRRRRQRQPRRADDDRERDLHARGGRRHPLEAHRLAHQPDRGAPLAPARRLVRSRPSATTSTASTGTSTRTARSSSRSS